MVFRSGLIKVKLYQYRVFKSDSQTYVATRHDSISAGADHSLLHLVAPPVKLGAGGVVHHGQESLLQGVGDGPTGCGEKRSGENVPLRKTVCFKFHTKLSREPEKLSCFLFLPLKYSFKTIVKMYELGKGG